MPHADTLPATELLFVRSFNFDHERKADRKAKPRDWEMVGDGWFPFVRVDLDAAVTAVVGANESGKSHLVEAVKQALTGHGIDPPGLLPLFVAVLGRDRQGPPVGLRRRARRESDDDVAALSGLPIEAKLGEAITLLRLGDGTNLLVDASGGRLCERASRQISL
jgi:hypothetical protein